MGKGVFERNTNSIIVHDTCNTTYHLCLYHVADCLIKRVDLVRLEVTDDGPNVVQDLLNEWHHFERLHLDKMASALLCYLDECVTRHVLYTIVGFCAQEGREE